jgi:predicted DCC family thiol-disulfide oxidoreductase YuxK
MGGPMLAQKTIAAVIGEPCSPLMIKPAERTRHRITVVLVFGLVYFIAALVVFWFFLDRVIAAIDPQALHSFLSKASFHRNGYPLAANLTRAQLFFSRASLAVIFADLAIAAFIGRDTIKRLLRDFFWTPTSPVNLAIFRIAVFGTTLLILHVDAPATKWFSTFPRQLVIAPYGTGWILPYIPISQSLVGIVSGVLVVFCIMGMIGLFSRASSAIAIVLGLYVLGITQVFGKVSHDQAVIWFLAILAASPCGDALAIDAIWTSRKRADQGTTELPGDLISYALPLRFACVLLGVIYFFPGFWKVWNSGFGWALSDNLKYQMYSKWMEFGGWTPFFRLDWHPWLYRALALGTIVFEMSFIVLIFFPRLRRAAAAGGVTFNLGTLIFLRIFFYDLLIYYVALFDVSGWLKKVGGRLFKAPLNVFYDGSCNVCRRAIASIRTVDVFDRIVYMDAREDPALDTSNAAGESRLELLPDIYARSGARRYRGAEVYRAMAARIPILWPLVPFLFLPPVDAIANRVYSRVKHGRTCAPVNGKDDSSEGRTRVGNSDWNMATAVGVLLVAANVYTGARGIVSGWPFACYPTFAPMAGEEIISLEVVALDARGEIIPTDTSSLRESFSHQRLRGLLESVARLPMPGGSLDRLRGVWQLYVQKDPQLGAAASVRFYRATLRTVPGDQHLNPLQRELIAEIKL